MKLKSLLLCFFLIFGITLPAYATTILYDVTNLGGGTWEYEYTVTNDTLTTDIEEFTIYFDYGLYDNLNVTSPLIDWDELTVDPDLIFGFPEDGFYDALALVSGIAPGNTVSGFSVSFDWLGAGIPGSQFFEVVDPFTFNVLDSADTAPIPEPATMLLLGSGLSALAIFRKKLKKSHLS